MDVYSMAPAFDSVGYDHLPLEQYNGYGTFFFSKTYKRGLKNISVFVYENGSIETSVYNECGVEFDYTMPRFHKNTIESQADIYEFDSFMVDAVKYCEILGKKSELNLE